MRVGNVPVVVPHRSNDLFSGMALIALLLPFTMLVQFKIVGTLFLYDIAAPALLAILIMDRSNREMLSKLTAVWLILALWLVGVVATDIVRNTSISDLLRGWSRLGLLSVNIAVIWIVCGRNAKFVGIYGISTGLVFALQPFVNPGEFSADDPWKFGMATGSMLIVASLSTLPFISSGRGRYIPVVGLVLLSIVSLAQNTRTIFAIGALTAVFTIIVEWTARHRRGKSLHPAALIGLVIVGAILTTGIFQAYGHAAGSGWLGDAARAKYLVQSSADVSLLLAGRSESLASIQAIKDAPILGHGSWAVNPYYTLLWFTKMRELGIDATAHEYQYLAGQAGFVIPSHSHLLGSWVEAGILSVPFWLWVIVLCVRAIYSLVVRPGLPAPLITMCALLVLWDVLFSPFGAEARIIKAFQVVVLLLAVFANGGSVLGRVRRVASADAAGGGST